MSNPQILNEYLVRLGFEPDRVGYARFTNALRDVEGQVNNRYWNMAKRVGEFEAATLGAFAAIGVGTLGFMDRVAMADQSYRLFALRMYTSLPVARELKVALDALGQPLENVMWDPELAERFHQLVKDQQILAEQLGPNFEKNMRSIRDARFELTRFGVEMKYLGMEVVNDLFQSFGMGGDDLVRKLHYLNDYIIAAIPYWSLWITVHLKPALVEIGKLFQDIIDKIYGINWDKVGEGLDALITALTQSSRMMLHLATAAVDVGKGDFSAAWSEAKEADKLSTPGSRKAIAAALGYGVGGVTGAAVAVGADVMLEGARISPSQMATFARPFADQLAKQYHMPASFFMDQWAVETGGFQSFVGGKFNLGNVKIPGTNTFANPQSLAEGAKIYGDTIGAYIQRYGRSPQALGDFAHMLKTAGPEGKSYYDVSEQQYAAGMARYGDIYITVNAKTDATAEDIARKIDQVLQESLRRPPKSESLQIQRNINEFSVPGWAQP